PRRDGLATAVGDRRLDAELLGKCSQAMLRGRHEVRAEIDDLPGKRDAVHAAANAVARLDDGHGHASVDEPARAHEPGEARADDDDIAHDSQIRSRRGMPPSHSSALMRHGYV